MIPPVTRVRGMALLLPDQLPCEGIMPFKCWLQFQCGQLALANDELAIDHAVIDVDRRTEHERSDGIMPGPGELDAVEVDRNKVSSHTRREAANIIAAQDGGPASCRHLQRFTGGHGCRAAEYPLQEHCLPRFSQQMPAVVGSRAIDA